MPKLRKDQDGQLQKTKYLKRKTSASKKNWVALKGGKCAAEGRSLQQGPRENHGKGLKAICDKSAN